MWRCTKITSRFGLMYIKSTEKCYSGQSGDDTPGSDGDPSGTDNPPGCMRTESLPEVDLPTPPTPQEPLQHMATKFLWKNTSYL